MVRLRSRPVRLGWLAGLSLIGLIAAGVAPPRWSGLTATSADGSRLTVGAVRLGTGLIAAALAQDAQTVVLESVVLELGPTTYRLPRIEFTGADLSRADLAGLFDKTAAEPLPSRLARLSAQRIAIPELVVEQQIGTERQTTRYSNVTGTDLNQGRIRAILAEAGALETKGGRGNAVSGTLGRIAMSDLDLAQAARVYIERSEEAPGDLKRISGAFSLENLDLRTDKDAEIRITRITGRDFSARPTKNSLVETMKVLGAADAPDKASPAEQARLLGASVEIFDAMAVGSLEAVGIEIRDPSGKEQVAGRIQRIAYKAADGTQPSDARIEGLDVATKDGRTRIGAVAFTGFALGPTVEGLRELADGAPAEADAAVLRKLIPTLGALRLSGLDVDVPNQRAQGPKKETIRFGVKEIELTADRPVNGIPTDLRLAVEHLTFDVPGDTAEQGLKDLAAMGYRAVDLSWTAAANWNEPGSELVVREVSLRGSQMGSVTLRGVLGNVGRDVFNPDSALALVALVGATAKSLDLTIENGGLFERFIAREAKINRGAAEKLRREYGMAAAIGVPTMLGGSPAAKAIGQAVARFIAKPGRLTLSARTKDAGGLGIADLTAFDQPGAILERLDITAAAE